MKLRNLLRGIFDPGRPPKEVLAVMEKVRKIACPKGDRQITEEAEMLYAVLNKRISLEDLRIIVGVTKPMFYMENITQNGVI